MLHIGYILLLDRFDEADPEYGTVMARFLREVQGRGIRTSIDVVSDSSANYAEKILPALRYCNYAIVNEIECCSIFGLPAANADGSPNEAGIRRAMEGMAKAGVAEKVIVHAKPAGYCLDVATGRFTAEPALNIPKSLIKGSVGAGDAFCAGCLYGLYNGYEDPALLRFAAAAAACSLLEENAVDGMRTKEEILAMIKEYGGK